MIYEATYVCSSCGKEHSAEIRFEPTSFGAHAPLTGFRCTKCNASLWVTGINKRPMRVEVTVPGGWDTQGEAEA